MFHEQAFYNHIQYERQLSPRTVGGYTDDLTRFITFCTTAQCLTSVTEVRHLHVRAWIVDNLEKGRGPRTVNRSLSCLKTYFKFLRKRNLVEKDPMLKVIAPKFGKRLPVVVQENQLAMLFNHVEFKPGYEGMYDRLILEILYATGMRRSELTTVKVSDVDLSRFHLKVLGKGRKERLIPFAQFLANLLEQFIRARAEKFPSSEEPWLLLNKKGLQTSGGQIYQIVHKYLSFVTTVEQRSPHVLRHSFATHLSNNGADLNAIKELLGHANLGATQIYMHNSIDKLKKVYEQAHPKSKESES